jgi:hypothetical protein
VGAPESEYGIEIEIRRFFASSKTPILYYFGLFSNSGGDRYEIVDTSVLLPRLSIGPRDEFDKLLSIIDVDLYGALGIRRMVAPTLKVNI